MPTRKNTQENQRGGCRAVSAGELRVEGAKSVQRVSATISTARMRSKVWLGVTSASSVPTAAPPAPERAATRVQPPGSRRWRAKPQTAPTFCNKMAIRLVPLAIVAGSPRKMSSGKVRKDPPPATTLSAPARAPAAKRRRWWLVGNSTVARVRAKTRSLEGAYPQGRVRRLRRSPDVPCTSCESSVRESTPLQHGSES